MPNREFNVLFTRKFEESSPGGREISQLKVKYPGRIILGSDMNIPDYYRALWSVKLQVSTALHESLGISTLEAMYTENCCLLPSRGSYPEISRGDSRVLYTSTSELEAKLAFYLDHPNEASEVGHSLALHARRHGADQVIPRVISVINEVLR